MKCPECFTDISASQDYVKLINKAEKARCFLEGHPATGGSMFDLHRHLEYSAQEVCKRGYSRIVTKDGVPVYYTLRNYRRYKDRFDEVIKEGEPRDFSKIEVPYSEHFREPWIFHRVVYWSEMGFVMFKGGDFKNNFKQECWESCCGVEAKGNNFEEMIINTAHAFKKVFGDFSKEDFLTTKEKLNLNRYLSLNLLKGLKSRKYPYITAAEINHRWLKWFAKTPYAQKNWKDTINECLKGF